MPKCKLQSRCCILLQLVPVPIDLQQLALVVFSFHQLAQTLYLHSGWLLSATCTGGLVHRSTGAYTACTACNLHCVVVVVVYIQHKHSTCTQGCYPWQLALVVLFIAALAHILHAQLATYTVMVVHGGGSGVMEVVPWDSSMWWLYINVIIIIFGHVTL